ncbi:MAG TPA: ABC transporter ATP-binding protein, partial [Bacteroidales bacterium]|nr:ABC transporter ATP-binding protein [Bacteroidales bacterium]
AIVIENLSKNYKNNRGIQDINLEIDRGEIFGFLGPDGAGKTTTMKIMVGLMKADKGDVRINGYSISDDYEQVMKNVGCIIENVTPFPYLTAYENMKLYGRFYDDVDELKINKSLDITGLIKYKNEKIKNYSLGMKQRLGIAIATLSNPNIMILDEPFNGLDVEGMVEMRELIIYLSKQHKTTFFISSHLIHDIELTCDKVGILYHGKLLGIDSTKNILKNYSSLENYYLSEVDLNGDF